MSRSSLPLLVYLLFCGTAAAEQLPIVVDAQKDSFYLLLTGPADGRLHISHADFLPRSGPAPRDDADCSAEVWAAWDTTYFYLYAEVRDDTVRVNNVFRPENDCLELKFDPDPSRKAWGGIVNARLTALDTAEAEEAPGVDNLYREVFLSTEAAHPVNYARRLTADGYIVELRLAWKWIALPDRNVPVGVGRVFGFSVTIHDNDREDRDGSIQWSAGMADEVWNVPQLLGSVEFLENRRLKFLRRNSIDPLARPGKTYLAARRFTDPKLRVLEIENWRYHDGDDMSWADPGFDDSGWELVCARMAYGCPPRDGWKGFGWFRASLAVDSSIARVPLAMHVLHPGASEVYLDGSLLQTYGVVGTPANEEVPRRDPIPRVLVFPKPGEYVVAVRYSHRSPEGLAYVGISPGFQFFVRANADSIIANHVGLVRTYSRYQFVFTVVPLFLAIFHLALYLYYRRTRENLYFSAAMLCWAVVAYSDFSGLFTESVQEGKTLQLMGDIAVFPALMFGLLTMYEILLERIPRHFVLFVLLSVTILLWGFLAPSSPLGIAFYVLFGSVSLETLRAFVMAGRERRRRRWIAGAGFLVLMLALIGQFLANLRILPGMILYPYGLLALAVAVSIDLARVFARTRRDLEEQLVQVRDLSERTLTQERLMKEEEIARKVLEADNLRKTKELEEARKLQLSMLPRQLPRVPFLELAAYTQPASEVGGDYYDFRWDETGVLTVAVGDATGHGMKAGTMVATVKGLFSANGAAQDPLAFFRLCGRTIRDMHLGNLYMAMLLATVRPDGLRVASAGMPPVLVARGRSSSVEELVFKSMPLGATPDFPYSVQEVRLTPGDTVLFMSDGLMELFDEKKELFDYSRVREAFRAAADQRPEAIIADLIRAGDTWRRGEPSHDDMTFVVLKVRG